jgi:hypothetical protein
VQLSEPFVLTDFFRQIPLATCRTHNVTQYDNVNLQEFFRHGLPAQGPARGEAG